MKDLTSVSGPYRVPSIDLSNLGIDLFLFRTLPLVTGHWTSALLVSSSPTWCLLFVSLGSMSFHLLSVTFPLLCFFSHSCFPSSPKCLMYLCYLQILNSSILEMRLQCVTSELSSLERRLKQHSHQWLPYVSFYSLLLPLSPPPLFSIFSILSIS